MELSVETALRTDATPAPGALVPIVSVVVGERVRKQMGDLKGLAASLRQHGLLHPIVLLPDRTLVAGHRRLLAASLAGWTEIPATIIDVADLLSAEKDENGQRKDFTPTEAVAIGRLIEKEHRVRVKAAQAARAQRLGRRRAAQACENASPATTGKIDTDRVPPAAGRTGDTVGPAVGLSGPTYYRAKTVVAASEADPERYGDLAQQMDETGNVNGAFNEMRRRGTVSNAQGEEQPAAPTQAPGAGRSARAPRHPIHRGRRHPVADKMIQRAIDALEGICTGLEQIDATQADGAPEARREETMR